ncbi:two-component system response regulator YesN [Paenibacillus mucilaginosus]|uniref:response regulator transcription factor n=1 Tax=Paenibacillus mucilaginosus TaxID=61624 RepID=UPI003D2090EA
MFKVLLVDDEVFVRKGLQKLIRWEQFKFTLVGEAKNGGDALAMINTLEPDLIITDIMMPVLDGLGLIRSVKEAGRVDPEFIIISGYNDFKYAQQAIRFGVQDYILKPIDVNELAVTLKKLAEKIRRKRMITLTGRNFSVASTLEALLKENLQEEDAEWYAEVLGMEGVSGYLYAYAEVHAAPGLPQVGLKVFEDMLCSCEKAGIRIPVLEQRPGLFGMLLSTDLLHCWGRDLSQALEAIRVEISTLSHRDVTLFAGDTVKCITHIKQSYLSANEALKHKFAECHNEVILYDQVKDKPHYSFALDPSICDPLMIELEENNKVACKAMIESLFQTFHEQRFTPPAVVSTLSRFSNRVMGVMKQMKGNDEGQRRLLETMEGEYHTWSLQQLKEHFTHMVSDAAENIAELRRERMKGDIEKIKKYIDSHYKDNINLKSIAAHFYMNSVYLGQLFRKTYGVYFNDYLLELRVKEAKVLLRQTDLRMYEIAARVGIQNANYFVTQFEKLEKCSPMEYRNKLVKKE